MISTFPAPDSSLCLVYSPPLSFPLSPSQVFLNPPPIFYSFFLFRSPHYSLLCSQAFPHRPQFSPLPPSLPPSISLSQFPSLSQPSSPAPTFSKAPFTVCLPGFLPPPFSTVSFSLAFSLLYSTHHTVFLSLLLPGLLRLRV